MKIAIVPSSSEYLNNKIFDIKDKKLNRDNLLIPYYKLKEYLNERNIEIQTYDMFKDLKKVDYIFFFSLNYKIIIKCLMNKMENKMIYFAWEPEVVIDEHSESKIFKLKKYFKYIFTWNDDLVNKKGFYKINNPYYFEDINLNKKEFKSKKLMTNISGNKYSNNPKELYTARRNVIQYFEDSNSNEFDFYGVGWNKKEYKNYKGIVDDKIEIYQNYKFALSLENMIHTNGYITEKILDCFKAEIVPIYLGPDNICEYIPNNTFINYADFDNVEQLVNYLSNMSEDTYNNYIKNIRSYKKSSKINIFSSETFIKYVSDLIYEDKNSEKFNCNLIDKFKIIKMFISKKFKDKRR